MTEKTLLEKLQELHAHLHDACKLMDDLPFFEPEQRFALVDLNREARKAADRQAAFEDRLREEAKS